GTGKTTLAMEFLIEGARNGERTLYVSLSETRDELAVVAERHGWSLSGIDIFELVPAESVLDPSKEVTVLHPAEFELSETLQLVTMRGIEFRGGFHDCTIRKGGLQIFPRLVASEHHRGFSKEYVPSGSAELDQLLGGGLERGTNALLLGAAGVGKSSIAVSF